MQNRSLVKKIVLLGSLVFFAIVIFSAKLAHAQTSQPQFLISWKSFGSYVPPSYNGKALPSYGSKMIASLELISNGKVLNIKSQTIYWYLNSVLIGGGVGTQQVSFSPFGVPPNSLALEVNIPNYNGAYLDHVVTIPMVSPVMVLYAPYPDNQFSVNPVTVTSLPYYFDIASPADLSYSWSVNGQTGTNTEDPENAQISLPSGTPSGTNVDVSLKAVNPLGSIPATAEKNLIYQSQL